MKPLPSFLFLLFFSGSAVFAQTNTFPTTGNVGIGTTSPANNLHVNGTARIQGTLNFSNTLSELQFGGTAGSISKIQTIAGTNVDRFIRFRTGGSAPIGFAGVQFSSFDNYSWFAYAGQSNEFIISGITGNPTTKGSVGSSVLVLTQAGNIGMGVTNPTNKLEVNGTIKTKEVNVSLSGWPDYVFDPAYNLMPLQELGTYVNENRHLPEIPTEKEVEANGVDLGEMNKLLLKKVEELTLYLIQNREEINALKAEVDALKETKRN